MESIELSLFELWTFKSVFTSPLCHTSAPVSTDDGKESRHSRSQHQPPVAHLKANLTLIRLRFDDGALAVAFAFC
jgi:hypothetical protein